MTKYYFDLDLFISPFKDIRKAVKVTNNYLIRFVDSDILYYFRVFKDDLKNAYVIDDEITHQKILFFNDGDLYLLENKY